MWEEEWRSNHTIDTDQTKFLDEGWVFGCHQYGYDCPLTDSQTMQNLGIGASGVNACFTELRFQISAGANCSFPYTERPTAASLLFSRLNLKYINSVREIINFRYFSLISLCNVILTLIGYLK